MTEEELIDFFENLLRELKDTINELFSLPLIKSS